MNQDNIRGSAENAKQNVKRVASTATTSPAMEALLRLGYIVRGLVYGVIGLLALQEAIGGGGQFTGPQGAIAKMGQTSLGGIVLYFILVGLIGYGLWGFIRAIADPQHKGTKPKGIIERIGYAISGISYLLLGAATSNLIQGASSGASNNSQSVQIQQSIGGILATKPGGQLMVAIIALVIVGIGISQIYQGARPSFEKQFRPYALNAYRRMWIVRLGRIGYPARGLVFTLIGLFLLLAAVNNNPSQAQGIDGVLAALMHQSFGPWLLGIVALGLVIFGIFSALCGFWLRLRR
jgi:hypothetical protein